MKKTILLAFIALGLCLCTGLVSCDLFHPPGGGGSNGQAQLIECISNAGCDDGDVCTTDVCTINLSCRNVLVEDCCFEDSDCYNCDCPGAVCKNNRCSDDPCCDETLSCDHLGAPGDYICEQSLIQITDTICRPVPN